MGALDGIRIIEIAGLGPAPFAGMMLADHGAQVIRIEQPGKPGWDVDILSRSRDVLQVNLKAPEGRDIVRRLAAKSHGLIEGFRPGVMERLGLAPEVLLGDNPALVYGRMTGWGQNGPYAHAAGHDINYIAMAGALAHMGRQGEKPTPPINLVGDFGGGGMLLAFGMVTALLSACRTGVGQVVDCAMVDGTALLMAMTWSLKATQEWSDERGSNLLDTGAHFYEVYECADGNYISVAAIEPQFYAALLRVLEMDAALRETQMDRSHWPEMKARFAARFKDRSAEEWCAHPEAAESCLAPVLTMSEAARHPHNVARSTFTELAGVIQPSPAPRFSATPAAAPRASDDDRLTLSSALLREVGLEHDAIHRLQLGGVIG
ncbi:CaiB/BaiF CoA-transferase family protein [Novosphingobium sp. 9U]|uniref:CaiB/BaiF CoA transferase family protein n=1 Tax=Novosphingobium sp. 9U TaxID=2653158 RepID=UPI0012F075CE|nr:CaiB/BaiF CoA-transferase family protein [Novosphingobium sp. 9U]VWX50597.1 Carnitine dehydratase [Novosphingobium sp. 9U]